MRGQYYVYIATNKSNFVLYTGITNDLVRRIYEHKNKLVQGFTSRYNVNKLVFYEVYELAYEAITREKQIKNWHREWKINLVKSKNPHFEDLYKYIT